MKVSRERVLESRKLILEAAGRLFRERGFASVTVSEVMKAAGLTHGGFYGYFKSKEDLIAQSLADLLERADIPPGEIGTIARQYLSPDHRDNWGLGCPVAALAPETIRSGSSARAEMTAGLERRIDGLARAVHASGEALGRRAAIGSLAAMVGALILARASEDAALSNEILDETSAWLGAQKSASMRE
jgi:TetR/AcrR family transcriptional repressor of nem operon